jgi:tRNA pseudouridine32 synthase/23S rRNA pseudouridine746 synthase
MCLPHATHSPPALSTCYCLTSQDLNVIFEDEHIVVVSKPAGVLTIPDKDESNPSPNKAVFDKYGSESGRMDKMVVHRLGMDTSGLVVFARTNAALRQMNTLFRTRKVTRKYEALVAGHVASDEGSIDLPLMRDYECPPYMRVSTDDHQRALIDLDPSQAGKKILENPKDSLTKYEVLSREDMGGNDVTRLMLTSITGRTHQLNVHCAAIGHPIVGDTVYGYAGEAASNGGLDESELPADKASEDLQKAISEASAGKPMCVHAKSISFRHPVTKEELSFESSAPF